MDVRAAWNQNQNQNHPRRLRYFNVPVSVRPTRNQECLVQTLNYSKFSNFLLRWCVLPNTNSEGIYGIGRNLTQKRRNRNTFITPTQLSWCQFDRIKLKLILFLGRQIQLSSTNIKKSYFTTTGICTRHSGEVIHHAIPPDRTDGSQPSSWKQFFFIDDPRPQSLLGSSSGNPARRSPLQPRDISVPSEIISAGWVGCWFNKNFFLF